MNIENAHTVEIFDGPHQQHVCVLDKDNLVIAYQYTQDKFSKPLNSEELAAQLHTVRYALDAEEQAMFQVLSWIVQLAPNKTAKLNKDNLANDLGLTFARRLARFCQEN